MEMQHSSKIRVCSPFSCANAAPVRWAAGLKVASEFDSNISAAVAPADNPDGKFVPAFD